MRAVSMELEVTLDGGTGGNDGDWKTRLSGSTFKFSQQSDAKESPAIFLTINRWAQNGRIITSNIQNRS